MKRTLLTLTLLISLAFPLNAQQYETGCLFDEDAYEQIPLTAPLTRGDYAALPAQVSLKKYAPKPGNQGGYGTCVGWATAYAARTIVEALQNEWTNRTFVTHHAFSPSYVYNQIRLSPGCSNGTYIVSALGVIRDQGVPKLSDFGYECARAVRFSDRQQAASFKIKDFKRIIGSRDVDKVTPVKKSLSERKPVVFGMRTPGSFHGARAVWSPAPSEYRSGEGGHAMAVIGYDDTKSGGAFEIINSWGTGWGNAGFTWIRYDDFNYFCREAFELIENIPTKPLAGGLRFIDALGDEMKADFNGQFYDMRRAYRSGTAFRVLIANEHAAYVYAFGSDRTRKSTRIFPPTDRISAYLGYRQNNVAIPDEDHFIQLDEVAGTDYFCVLYSKEKLDLDQILQQMEVETGDFSARLRTVLGSRFVASTNIDYKQSGTIGFEAKSRSSGIVPIVVAIRHAN